MSTPTASRGTGTESRLDRLLKACEVQEGGQFYWHAHHPPIRGGTRGESGLPDREVVWNGRAYLIEAKEETGTSCSLGRLIKLPKGVKPDHGVTWQQAEEMDRHTKAGVPCFVFACLAVPAKPAPKRRQARLQPEPERKAVEVLRIVPWPEWRALMARAEEQREAVARWQMQAGRLMVLHGPTCPLPPKPEVQASIPAADLAAMGWPCRNAAELLAAIRGS